MNAYRYNRIATLSLAAVLLSPLTAPAQYAPPNQPRYQDASGPNQSNPYDDPPSRVARISVVNGNVSFEPAGVDAFSQAELNYPLTAGDRLYADNSSMSELQTSGLALRLGNGADVTLSSLTDDVAQFGLAQGSIRLRTRDLNTPDGSTAVVEIDTPNGTVVVTRPGDIRVDSYPQDDTTVVTVSSGQVEITGPNLDTALNPGQSLRLAGTNPVYTQALRLLPPDALDNFATGRERDRQQSFAITGQYVDPGMIGAGDLAQYGDWNPDPEYGAVWFPRAVDAGWTPYSNGHWAWVAPWGWTWIEAEPWGFAPFHYGRWASFGPPDHPRWGWVAGPPPSLFAGARPPRPVYSPALVAFVGGPRFSLSVGFGAQSGAGVTAWFPLGPREAYQPWYHASPAYVNRVNVTNLYTRNAADVRNTYNNRTTNIYNVTNVNYINRPAATVAVTQRDFASGRGIAQSQHIRMDGNAQRQLLQAPLLPHPLVTPQAGAAAPQMPARALPPNQNRPVLETRQGFERAGDPRANGSLGNTGATPNRSNGGNPQPTVSPQMPARVNSLGTEPMTPRQTNSETTPQVRAQAPIPVQTPAQPPTQARQPFPAGMRGNFPQQRDHTPVTPGQQPATTTPQTTFQTTPQTTLQTNNPASVGDRRFSAPRSNGAQPATPPPTPAVAPQMPAGARTPTAIVESQRPIQRSPDTNRPLINRTEPQPVQPSFPQQQRAIQANDPGRPLGPQQVQNLRQGQPAGAPAQPDRTSHPPASGQQTPPDRQQRNKDRPASVPPQGPAQIR